MRTIRIVNVDLADEVITVGRIRHVRTVALMLAMVLAGLAGAGPAAAAELGVITGGEKGTYYQFGLNLQALARKQGLALSVYPSRGSIENVQAVYERPGIPLGIVQSDVLAFVGRMQSDPALKRIARKTRMVFPLYNEEVHLLARPEIQSFDDLAGRRVAIGREGSGTYLTSRLLFSVSEVSPREMVPIDTDEALAELKAGRVDAMFYVAGMPVKLFAEGLGPTDDLRFVPITQKAITEFYPTAEIPANTYRAQPVTVPTVAVKAVLISFDFRGPTCATVGQLARAIADHQSWLASTGHPKWKSVDFDAELRGWEQYDCVRKALGKPTEAGRRARGAANVNVVLDAVKQALGDH